MSTEYQVLNAKSQETISAITNGVVRTFNSDLIHDGRTKIVEADVTVEDEAVRFWTTGESPTASVGILAEAGAHFKIKGYNDIKAFKCISTTGTNAKLTVQYYAPF